MKNEPTPYGAALAESSGLEGIESATLAMIGDLVGGLIVQNWSQIKSCREQSESIVALSIGVTIDASGTRPIVKSKIGYAQKFSDAADGIVDDPNQEKLDLDRDGAPLPRNLKKAAAKLNRVTAHAEIGGDK